MVAKSIGCYSYCLSKKEVRQIKGLLMEQRALRRYTAKDAEKNQGGQKIEVDQDVSPSQCPDSSLNETQADTEKAQTATEQNDVVESQLPAWQSFSGIPGWIHFPENNQRNSLERRIVSAPPNQTLAAFLTQDFVADASANAQDAMESAADAVSDCGTEQLQSPYLDAACAKLQSELPFLLQLLLQLVVRLQELAVYETPEVIPVSTDTPPCQSNEDENGTQPSNELEGLDTSEACTDTSSQSTPVQHFSGHNFILPGSAWQPRPQRQNPEANKCKKVEKEVLTSTTVRLANVPNNMKRKHLMKELDEFENGMFWGKYDFLYLAFDWVKGDNLGYAFINFLTLEDAKRFQAKIEGHQLKETSKKKCRVGNADAQGLDACLQKFKGSHPVNKQPRRQRPIQWVNDTWRLLTGESDIEDS